MIHYDQHLGEKIPGRTIDRPLLLNETFADWEKHIERNLRTRSDRGGLSYQYGPDSVLLGEAKEHEAKYNTAQDTNQVLLLTHPFYLQLTHMHHLHLKETFKESEAYLSNTKRILEAVKEQPVDVVVLDTLHHYTAASSVLLEQGYINQVIFTQYKEGTPIESEKPIFEKRFKDKEVFMGGSYNAACFGHSLRDIRELLPEKNIWVIDELVLNSPQLFFRTLKPDHIYAGPDVGVFPPGRVISIDTVLEKLDGQPKP